MVATKIGTQRRLAAKYRVILVPKHRLTAILGHGEATSDGLHLAQMGQDKMLALVLEVLNRE